MNDETIASQCNNHCEQMVEIDSNRRRMLSPDCARFLHWFKYGHIFLTILFCIYVTYSFTKWQVRLGDIDCSFLGVLFTVFLTMSVYGLLHLYACMYYRHLVDKWTCSSGENDYDVARDRKKVSIVGVWVLLLIDVLLMFGVNYSDCEWMRKELESCMAHPDQHRYRCSNYDATHDVCPEWQRK